MSTYLSLKLLHHTAFLLCLNLVIFQDPATNLCFLPLLSTFNRSERVIWNVFYFGSILRILLKQISQLTPLAMLQLIVLSWLRVPELDSSLKNIHRGCSPAAQPLHSNCKWAFSSWSQARVTPQKKKNLDAYILWMSDFQHKLFYCTNPLPFICTATQVITMQAIHMEPHWIRTALFFFPQQPQGYQLVYRSQL